MASVGGRTRAIDWPSKTPISSTVSGVTFRNQNGAAIDAYLTAGTNVYQGNDYSSLASGAVAVSTGHL